MSGTTYRHWKELNLDFEHQCDYCLKQSRIVERVFTYGETYSSSFFDKRHQEAQVEAASLSSKDAIDVVTSLSGINIYVRCEECGHYNSEDLNKLRNAYSFYYKNKKEDVFGCLFWVILLAGFFVYGVFKVIKSGVMPPVIWLFAGLTLIGIIAIIMRRPMSVKKFESRLNRINDEKVVEAWLKNWRTKGKKHLKHFEDCLHLQKRHRIFDYDVRTARHWGDPFSADFFYKSLGVTFK